MGAKYTTTAIAGYNSAPPSDDGTVTDSNKVKWSTIKTKLDDPIKTLVEAINTKLVTAFDTSAIAKSVAYTTTAADNGKPILVTGTTTISLEDAATMGAGYSATIANVGAGVVTVNLITAANTLNGTANGSVSVPINGSMTFSVNSGTNGYVITSVGGELASNSLSLASGTTATLYNTVATTVNAFGAASTALNIGHASAAAAFAGGISIPTGKSVTGAGTATVTGFATVSATTLTGTLSTAAQPNVTSVGTLTSLTTSGAINAGANSISGGSVTLTQAGATATSVKLTNANNGAGIFFGIQATGSGYINDAGGAGIAIQASGNIIAGFTPTGLAVTGFYEGTEQAAPAAGAANTGRIFFQDNGAGKTQLMVIFSSGAAQQIAIQP